MVACQLGMTHAATALADAALGTAYAEEGLSTAQADWRGNGLRTGSENCCENISEAKI